MVTSQQAIEHIKTSCYLVGYPTHDKEYETRKAINESLDYAISCIKRVEKIEQIVNEHWRIGTELRAKLRIKEALEQE